MHPQPGDPAVGMDVEPHVGDPAVGVDREVVVRCCRPGRTAGSSGCQSALSSSSTEQCPSIAAPSTRRLRRVVAGEVRGVDDDAARRCRARRAGRPPSRARACGGAGSPSRRRPCPCGRTRRARPAAPGSTRFSRSAKNSSLAATTAPPRAREARSGSRAKSVTGSLWHAAPQQPAARRRRPARRAARSGGRRRAARRPA